MADILQNIEDRLSFTVGASDRLRDQVASLDRFMNSQMDPSTSIPQNYYSLVASRPPVRLGSPLTTANGGQPGGNVFVPASASAAGAAYIPPWPQNATVAAWNQPIHLPDSVLRPFQADFSSFIFPHFGYASFTFRKASWK